ncbi:hypothetical protein PCIT_a3265 [Pseudoalteromonas citrea]|uniref:Uncharacterized protein n=1 Tax=Pseudoalteromonas citrea TaxID=43655 RepID=A0AAD4AGN2_9GAMM|nr:hypothetical protein PCIT_a3265 [Pseudoalteromonas citrea]
MLCFAFEPFKIVNLYCFVDIAFSDIKVYYDILFQSTEKYNKKLISKTD